MTSVYRTMGTNKNGKRKRKFEGTSTFINVFWYCVFLYILYCDIKNLPKICCVAYKRWRTKQEVNYRSRDCFFLLSRNVTFNWQNSQVYHRKCLWSMMEQITEVSWDRREREKERQTITRNDVCLLLLWWSLLLLTDEPFVRLACMQYTTATIDSESKIKCIAASFDP